MKKRNLSFDLMRVFAIVGVVAIHADVITSSPTNYLGGLSWWFANTIHSLMSVSVPLFIMLTGALVLHKPKVTYSYVLPKILKQFVVPFIVWWTFYNWWTTSRLGGALDPLLLFKRLLLTDVGHLYFLLISIGLYAVMPPLQRFLKALSPQQYYLFLGSVTTLSLLYEYLSFLVFRTYNQTNIVIIFLPFLTYVVWGYHLAKVSVTPKVWWLLLTYAFTLTGLISAASYYNTLALIQGNSVFWTPSGGNLFWEPFTLPIILLSGICFVLLNNCIKIFPSIFKSQKIASFMTSLSAVSFGIYLVHPLVMEQIDHSFHFSIQFIAYPLWIYYVQRITTTFAVSAVVVLGIARVPYLKMVLGNKKTELSR